MKHWIPILGLAVAVCASCVRPCRDTTLYQNTGRQKAIVAVLPVINGAADQPLPWDLSREFTDEIRRRAFDSTKVYLLRESGSLELAKQLNTPDPREIPLGALKTLGAAEFVVIGEIVEQKEIPHGRSHLPSLEEVGAVISLGLRVRVIDIRHEKPKVILQEVLNHEHLVARAYLNTDYKKAHWGTEAFERTPMGIAHGRIVREVVSRIESYVEAVR